MIVFPFPEALENLRKLLLSGPTSSVSGLVATMNPLEFCYPIFQKSFFKKLLSLIKLIFQQLPKV